MGPAIPVNRVQSAHHNVSPAPPVSANLVLLGTASTLGRAALESVVESPVDVSQMGRSSATGRLSSLGLLAPVNCTHKKSIFLLSFRFKYSPVVVQFQRRVEYPGNQGAEMVWTYTSGTWPPGIRTRRKCASAHEESVYLNRKPENSLVSPVIQFQTIHSPALWAIAIDSASL